MTSLQCNSFVCRSFPWQYRQNIWELVCQNQVSRAGTNNYTYRYLIPASAIKVLTHHECWMPCTYGTIFVSLVSYRLSSISSLQWRHSEPDGVSNHQPHNCLPNRLFGHRSKKTSKLRVTGLCEGNSPETDEFPAQRASNAEIVSIWWRHHVEDLWVAWHLWHGEANYLTRYSVGYIH